jgi:hypothetical protein
MHFAYIFVVATSLPLALGASISDINVRRQTSKIVWKDPTFVGAAYEGMSMPILTKWSPTSIREAFTDALQVVQI